MLLRNVSFFSPRDALRAPADFSPATQRGKHYDLDNLDTGHAVVEAITRYLDPGANVFDLEARRLAQEKTRGEARLIVQRVGQSAFKALVADAHHHRCALTGEKVRPILEAAHILPVSAGGEHRIDNGLLLRSDVHTL